MGEVKEGEVQEVAELLDELSPELRLILQKTFQDYKDMPNVVRLNVGLLVAAHVVPVDWGLLCANGQVQYVVSPENVPAMIEQLEIFLKMFRAQVEIPIPAMINETEH